MSGRMGLQGLFKLAHFVDKLNSQVKISECIEKERLKWMKGG